MGTFLKTDVAEKVATVRFTRPDKANAVTEEGWRALKEEMDRISADRAIRCVVLAGEGANFCGGIDLELLMSLASLHGKPNAQAEIEELIQSLQHPVNAIEQCAQPVIAAIQGACVGAGLDIAAACDVRICSEDAYFSIKEIDMGMVADLGSLQRLPTIIPAGFVAEMAYTGRNVGAEEAQRIGLVNHVVPRAELEQEAFNLALCIASKSPLSIRGTKRNLLYARDHTVEEGLQHIKAWNGQHLLSNDLLEAFQAFKEKRKPEYED